jgi:putative transposase
MRPLREIQAGDLYHAHPRGNDGRSIFIDDLDRSFHLYFFTKAAARFRWVVLGYCQMTSHYHFAVELPHLGLSDGMRWLQGEYARYWNKRHGHSGHLFRQRFGGRPIGSVAHLRAALRYIDLNPLAIQGISHPGDWPWSSYRAHVGLAYPPAYLDLTAFHKLFGATPVEACHVYERFVQQGPDPVSDTGFDD